MSQVQIFWVLFITFMVVYTIYVMSNYIQPLKELCKLFNVETWFMFFSVFVIVWGMEVYGYEKGYKRGFEDGKTESNKTESE